MSTLAKYPKATAITIYSLGIFLGLLHLFFGVIAFTPLISQDYHRETKINYNAFAKSLTFLHDFVDRVSLALYLRYFVSALQSVFGILLLENGHFLGPSFARTGNFGLILVDLVYLFFQLSVGSSYERIAPTIVFTVLLATRLLIVQQSSRKTRAGATSSRKTRTPKNKNKNE